MKSENFLPLLVQFLKLFHIANAKITTQNVLMQYLHHTNKPSLSELVKHILHLKVTFIFHTKQQNTKNGGCRQQQRTGGLTAQVGWLGLWSAATWCSTFIRWTLAMTFSWWQHHKHCTSIIIIIIIWKYSQRYVLWANCRICHWYTWPGPLQFFALGQCFRFLTLRKTSVTKTTWTVMILRIPLLIV